MNFDKQSDIAEKGEKIPQSASIDLPGGRFHYLSWNAQRVDLPGVLLLHGLTSSARTWTRVGSVLATQYRVYALDQRGHGKSIKSGHGTYSFQQLATDATAFLEAVELERHILIGHSWGGATALVLATGYGLQKPVPAFSHIVLEEPSLHFWNHAEEKALAYISTITQPASELRSEIAAQHPDMSGAEIEARIEAFQQITPEVIRSIFSQTDQSGTLLPLLAELTAPTLLMRADAGPGSSLDNASWEQAKRYLSPPSQATQIIGATHTIHMSKFNAFMHQLYEFLTNQQTF